MTPQGRSYCIVRLTSCPDLEALRRVWDSLGVEYQKDEEVRRTKDQMKERLK